MGNGHNRPRGRHPRRLQTAGPHDEARDSYRGGVRNRRLRALNNLEITLADIKAYDLRRPNGCLSIPRIKREIATLRQRLGFATETA